MVIGYKRMVIGFKCMTQSHWVHFKCPRTLALNEPLSAYLKGVWGDPYWVINVDNSQTRHLPLKTKKIYKKIKPLLSNALYGRGRGVIIC